MTEQIKSAIEQIQTEMIKDIDIPKSAKTELANQKALHLAIRSLSAWDEVLNELEEKKDVYKLVPISSTAVGNAYTYYESTICMAIDIINQKLSEIEKGKEL